MSTANIMPNTQAVNVCLLPRRAFALQDELLHRILHDATLDVPMLLDVPASVLCSLLTLVLVAIEEVGVGSDMFISLARALRDRASAHRTLKIRLLVALNHPSFPTWRLRSVVRERAYYIARSRLRAQLQEKMSTGLDKSESSEDWRPTSRAFCEALAERIFHPDVVENWAGSHRAHHGRFHAHHRTIDESFSYDKLFIAVQTDHKVVDDVHAAAVVDKLIKLSLAHPSNTSNDLNGTKSMRSHMWAAVHDAAHVSVYNDETTTDARQKQSIASIGLVMPVDLVDLQTLDFWTDTVFNKQAAPGFHFGYRSIGHPFHISSIERDGDDKQLDMQRFSTISEENAQAAHDALVVHSVVVRKVFSSLSRPYMVEPRRVWDGAIVDSDELHTIVSPNVLVKKGDNMMQDHCVNVMFQIFNYIWRQSTCYQNTQAIPHCLTYEVMPTGLQRGVMEGVPSLVSLGEIDWKAWYTRHAREESGATVVNMVHSAAGAYIGGYVLGAMDRHWSNMVIKDDRTLLHIDFSFILGNAPPIDAPRISIPPNMERLFRGVQSSSDDHNIGPQSGTSLWDAFVEATVTAYLALRKDAKIILRAAHLLFSRAGFDGNRVHGFLCSKSGLALEKSDKDAAEYLRRKIFKSSTHWKTQLKRFVHDIINPAWYHVVQNGPLPADGIMKLINLYQSESETTQRLNAQSAAHHSESGLQVDIDE